IGGIAQYINARNRWNWGVVAGHIPYLTGFWQQQIDPTTGDRLLQQFRRRIYVDQVGLLARYPFSMTRRFEVSGGYTRYGFETEIWSVLFNSVGQQISDVVRERGRRRIRSTSSRSPGHSSA